MLQVTCPSCTASVSVDEAFMGSPLLCPFCKQQFVFGQPAQPDPAFAELSISPKTASRALSGKRSRRPAAPAPAVLFLTIDLVLAWILAVPLFLGAAQGKGTVSEYALMASIAAVFELPFLSAGMYFLVRNRLFSILLLFVGWALAWVVEGLRIQVTYYLMKHGQPWIKDEHFGAIMIGALVYNIIYMIALVYACGGIIRARRQNSRAAAT